MIKRSLLALITTALLLSACAASRSALPGRSQTLNGVSAPSIAVAPAAPPAQAGGSAVTGSSSNPYSAADKTITDSAAAAGEGSASTAPSDRLVVRNAQMTIVVPDPIKTMDDITKLAGDMGGFVVSSNSFQVSLDNGGQAPEANVTIRVKAENLDAALQAVKRMVKDPATDVLSQNVTGQDVTKEYTDLQSRLKNLQAAEAQLREIMASATKPEDVLNVFNQLTQVREQIEVIQGQINYYQESASLSSIAVQIKAEATVKPLTIGKWQPAGVARDALQTTVNGLKTVANAAIWLVLFVLPIGIVIFIPLWLLWSGFRWLRRRGKPSKPLAPPAGTPPAEA